MKSNTFRTILILLFCWPMVQLSGQTFPNSPTGFYHRTATGGNWNQTSTWGNQTVPGTGQSVRIPQGVTVVVTNLNSAEVKFIRVEGTLIFRPTLNTKLTAETIYIASQGKLRMGTATRPIAVNRTAEIVFSNSGPAFNTIWDAREISRGLISDGQVVIAGSAKTNRVECDNSIQLGQTSINLHLPAPTNWRVNDELAIAGTQFKQGTHHSDEIVRFLSKGATQINLQGSTPIQKPHLRVRTDMNLHIANLTRNVILRSESASPIKARGHAMFRAGSDVDIRYASFIDLGRTDKTRALNERIITVNGTGTGQFTNIPGDSTNRRGRYSVHFHMNGPGPNVNKPTASVIGCVVRGTPGWGFVNHSSNVFFKDNICYDFKGAGFVTEAGDELGSFISNIAMHGVGQDRNGDGIAEKYYYFRHVFANQERPQPLGDFGFGGEGFWFQGPAIRAVDNVATNCAGSGMIWFTTGSPEVYSGKYVCFPANWINQVYGNTFGLQYRTNTNPYPGGNAGNVVLADLPILEMDGLDAYACLVGFKARFNNHQSISWYNEGPFDFHLSFTGSQNNLRQKVNNLRLWNNQHGLRTRYVSKTDFDQVKIINKLRYHDLTKYIVGAEVFHQAINLSFKNLTVSGYGISTWSKPNKPATAIPTAFFPPTVRVAYANLETGNNGTTCPIVTGVGNNTPAATSVNIHWASNSNFNHFLIRYQKTTDIKWFYREQTGGLSSINLTNLATATTYRYQVLGGCGNDIARWANEKTFTTANNKVGSLQLANDSQQEITLYPNPVTDNLLKLTVPKGVNIQTLKIYDLQGQLLLQPEIGKAETQGISLSNLGSQGMYLLEIRTNSGVKTLRFVKQ